MDPKKREWQLAMGKKHVRTCMELYKTQIKEGKYLLHEHPANAESWYLKAMEEVKNMPGVQAVDGPMCRFHMKSADAQGEGYVRKGTWWMTNSQGLAAIFDGRCSNDKGLTWLWHIHLINGRAKEARKYPPKLVEGILQRLRSQLECDLHICGLDSAASAGPIPEDPREFDEEEKC